MSVVRANVERLKGSIALQSAPGIGTGIRIALPVTLATVRVLIVEVDGHPYGLPAECVQVLKLVAPEGIFTVEGRNAVLHQGRPVSVARLADVLELPNTRGRAAAAPAALPCAVLCVDGEAFAVCVDALLDEQEVVLKPQSALLARVRNVSGATILDSGEICMVLNAQDLLGSVRKGAARAAQAEAAAQGAAAKKKAILLAEDSITTRTQETRILESAGYEVAAAADGLEAWNLLATRAFDAVVTDVMMPKLDGLGLAARIRREPRYAELPIILVTSLASDADKQRGLDAGANAYITKPAFDQQTLLDCLRRLI
jgi:two-component system chemotaxis sensor kinase CheA